MAPLRRPETARVYASVIENHVAKSPIAAMPIQRVRATDLEAFYAGLNLAPSSVTVCHAVQRMGVDLQRHADMGVSETLCHDLTNAPLRDGKRHDSRMTDQLIFLTKRDEAARSETSRYDNSFTHN